MGNLTSDGRFHYERDGENRLKAATVRQDGDGNWSYRWQYAYDFAGRRIAKLALKGTESPLPPTPPNTTGQSGSSGGMNTVPGEGYSSEPPTLPEPESFPEPIPEGWGVGDQSRFLWDGWNLSAEYRPDSFEVVRLNAWGLDLSQSEQGAGGVGGLLFSWLPDSGAEVKRFQYDGNGNVVALHNADNSQFVSYEFGPFGEGLTMTGDAGGLNTFKFSTKYIDAESGLVYYGYRYYNSSLGRWLNRDIAEESGGINLYGFVNGNPTNYVDMLGMWETSVHHIMVKEWFSRALDPVMIHLYANYLWPIDCDCVVNVEQLIALGSDEVDGVDGWHTGFIAAQSSTNAYQHAMRSPYEAIANAKVNYEQFVKEKKQLAKTTRLHASFVSKECDDFKKAIRSIGAAFHALSDSKSPSHAGFQIWYGPSDVLQFREDHSHLPDFPYPSYLFAHALQEGPDAYQSVPVRRKAEIAKFHEQELGDTLREVLLARFSK